MSKRREEADECVGGCWGQIEGGGGERAPQRRSLREGEADRELTLGFGNLEDSVTSTRVASIPCLGTNPGSGGAEKVGTIGNSLEELTLPERHRGKV